MSSAGLKPMITRIGSYGVITDTENVLLCRLSNEVPKFCGWWTMPGGGLDFGEHPEEAMVREVEEETGLLVQATSLLGINSFTIEGEEDDFHSIQIVYGARIIGGELRFEQGGTTDMCEWHNVKSLNKLETVELVIKAMEYAAAANL